MLVGGWNILCKYVKREENPQTWIIVCINRVEDKHSIKLYLNSINYYRLKKKWKKKWKEKRRESEIGIIIGRLLSISKVDQNSLDLI